MIGNIYIFSVLTTMALCVINYHEIVVFAGLHIFSSQQMKKMNLEDTEKNKFKVLLFYILLAVILAPLTLLIVLISKANNDNNS